MKPNLPTSKIFALLRKTKVIRSLFESIFGDTLLWGEQRELRSRHIISLWQENYPMKTKCLYILYTSRVEADIVGREAHQEPNGCRQRPRQTPVRWKSQQNWMFQWQIAQCLPLVAQSAFSEIPLFTSISLRADETAPLLMLEVVVWRKWQKWWDAIERSGKSL